METKIKGDKIKEGSIPLSALSSDMNIPAYIDFVKTLSDKDINTTLSIPYTNKVVLITKNDTRTLNSGESTIYSNYGATFTFTALPNASTLELHIDGQGSLDVFGMKVYKNINKIKKEFLPDNIGGADWNAQEGEAGYINNRTHYLGYKFSDTLGKGVTKMPYVYAKAAYFDNTIIEIPPFEDGLEINIVSGPPIYLKYIYEDDNQIIELIDNYNYFENKVIEFYQNIRSIEPAYIPDTVIKTTPQSLSDADKNQALANLGIDPVIWKYLCNPYILKNGETIPDELISEYDSDNFKYINKGMYLIHVDSFNINDKEWNMEGEINMYIPVYMTEPTGEILYGSFTFTDTEGKLVTATVNVYCNNGKVLINSYQN